MADVVFFSISALSNLTSSHVQEIYHREGGENETDGNDKHEKFFFTMRMHKKIVFYGAIWFEITSANYEKVFVYVSRAIMSMMMRII